MLRTIAPENLGWDEICVVRMRYGTLRWTLKMAGGGLNIDDRAGKWAVGMEICCRHRHGRASLRVVVAVSPETERRHHIPFLC